MEETRAQRARPRLQSSLRRLEKAITSNKTVMLPLMLREGRPTKSFRIRQPEITRRAAITGLAEAVSRVDTPKRLSICLIISLWMKRKSKRSLT